LPLYSFEGKNPRIGNNCFIAPNAVIIGDVEIQNDSSIWFGVVIRGDVNKIVIKKGTNIQDNSVIHVNTKTPTFIGENVTIGHGVLIHACIVKDRSLIGNRSVIHDEVIIGEESLIAPGAVVTDRTEIAPRSMVMGIPGKFKRELTNENLEKMKATNKRYIDLIKRYRENFFEITR
jgi:carbonic anhydrase/acetyltransferase-like protein (isoleucine patch superfamily)